MEGEEHYSLPAIWDRRTPALKSCFKESRGVGHGKERKGQERKQSPCPIFSTSEKLEETNHSKNIQGIFKTKRLTRAYKLLVTQARSLCLRSDAKHRPESPSKSPEVLGQLWVPNVLPLSPVRQEARVGKGQGMRQSAEAARRAPPRLT